MYLLPTQIISLFGGGGGYTHAEYPHQEKRRIGNHQRSKHVLMDSLAD